MAPPSFAASPSARSPRWWPCNLGYLVAGHLVDVLTGSPWEDYLARTLLAPLGMARTNTSIADLLADADHATAHEERDGLVVAIAPRTQGPIAPAGAINSSAADMARWLLVQLSGGELDGDQVLSPDALARQHAAHMVVPENRTFSASTRHAYGLGWLLGAYRGRRLLEHSGGVDDYQAECMVVPDEGIGVAVMTNTSSSAMAPVVAYRLLDELLGLEPLEWSAPLLARHDAARRGAVEARAARRVVPEARAPRSLKDYVGDYEHPGYGTLAIGLEADRLLPSYGTLELSLAHRHYETFDLTWHELAAEGHRFPLQFLPDPDGDIAALCVPFEPAVAPLVFKRFPDEESRDPDVLEGLCGTYAMGPIEAVVAMKDGTPALTLAVAGAPPAELEPVRRLRFRLRRRPGITAEFERDQTGAVSRLVLQPLGRLSAAGVEGLVEAAPLRRRTSRRHP